MQIRENDIIKKLLSLNLPLEDYAIFGSGPMFAHGIKDLGHDLDIVTRGKAWEKAKSLGNVVIAPMGTNLVVRFFNDEIEVFNGWAPGKWNVNELIDKADIIEGIRFVNLYSVIEWKKGMGREKDLDHIRMIEKYLENNKNNYP